ncbi:MAG: isocitrate/isopropylmalate dehydrogenase family protein [Methanotrichaceae archaeon]|nr:isocitrate/isopropylmalate dehydrogenase family protein [Methanotrichaceae archaeon]
MEDSRGSKKAGGGHKRITVIIGDGIGPEVIESALAVLDATGADLEIVPLEIGYKKWMRTGLAMLEEDLDTIKSTDCILFGAITTPPDPNYSSVLLRLRKELDLYANIRPFINEKLDFIIVRENTEGLYSGVEELAKDESRTVRIITRRNSKRIAEIACNLALSRRRLTIVHKSNVLKSDHLFLSTCREVAKMRGVPHEEMLVDTAAYNLVVRPERFDVLVTTNLFGDIISDVAAGIVGSLGLCASANIGDRFALFEPIHGSAPDIAGLGISNPIGAIRSAAMMMKWFGENEIAIRIEEAVKQSLNRGIMTPDLGGNCSTSEVTKAIINHLRA